MAGFEVSTNGRIWVTTEVWRKRRSCWYRSQYSDNVTSNSRSGPYLQPRRILGRIIDCS